MKILIAEDDENSRVFLERALLSQGYDVVSAGNGIQALEKAIQASPDLIISDIMMPKMDGFELCRLVKLDERLRAIPFVFYTATFAEPQDKKLAMSLGASRFLIKPMEPDEFFKTIQKVIVNHQQSEQTEAERPVTGTAELDRMYAETLARKLEKKVSQLEDALGQLRANEERFRNTFEQAAVGIAHVALDGRFLRVNQKLADIVGYSREGLQEKTFQEITCPDDLDTDRAYVRQLLEHRLQTYSMEKRYIHKDEHLVWVNLTVSLVAATSPDPGYFIAVVEDITRRKQLEAQLFQAQKMEAIGQLAGGVAHDFNNILTGIIGFGTLMDMAMDKKDPQRQNLNHILAGAERAANLTKSLLAFSRKQVSNPLPVDLNEIITKIGKFIQPIIGEDIDLKITVSNDVLIVKADTGQIEQVLLNLATNARDAMTSGGLLTIETEPVLLDTDFMKAHGYGEAGEYARISVSDSGCGMDDTTLKRVFEPFFTTKGVGKGTGLGLSMVYGIIKQHNGFINVYSELGVGTKFTIYLPMTLSAIMEDASGEEELLEKRTATILVADDDPSVRELSEKVLGMVGITVITAEDGNDAVEKFLENKDTIDLVVLDIIMSKMNGKEVYEKAKEIRPDIKVVFISGYAADFMNNRGMLDEKLEFVEKPFNPRRLLKKIQEVLDKTN
ncbi:MAG: response regulator [Geobacteraceae bacterium]|nr:response regulator [Geobacteraceae bacterium]